MWGHPEDIHLKKLNDVKSSAQNFNDVLYIHIFAYDLFYRTHYRFISKPVGFNHSCGLSNATA